MMVGRIIGATRNLGAPADWERDKQGICAGLPIRDDVTTAGPGMTSAWLPNEDEIARIVAGAAIHLTVLGTVHPPVDIRVGAPPERS